MVRAQGGKIIDLFLDKGIVAVGWGETGDLKKHKNQARIENLVRRRYPEYSGSRIRITSKQLDQFINTIQIGDNVVTYNPGEKMYHIGIVNSDYVYDSMSRHYPHTRKVKWYKQINKQNLNQDTQYHLRTLQTIFKIKKESEIELL